MSVALKYHFLRGLSRAICSMSYDHILAVGRFLGPAIMERIAKQRKRGLEQIQTGMECSRQEAEELLHSVYEHIGMSAMEMMYMPRLYEERSHLEDYIRIDHPEYLDEAYAEGKGIVGLTAHMGNWEWLGAGMALSGYHTSAIGKKQHDDALMEIINNYRAMVGQHIFLTGTGGYEMIAAARSMKKNYILGFLSDKDGNKAGVPVRFMNRVFSFPQGPAVFADRFKAPVVPLFITRNEGGKGHTIRVQKAFYYERTGDDRRDLLVNAQKMATIMENFIKKYPRDWLWFQHLFWTGPEKIRMIREMTAEEIHHLFDGLSYSKEFVNDLIESAEKEKDDD
jgi:lauroyl/myristoyl acyltransferase